MSNEPFLKKYYGFLEEVKGDVLITGLGIGFCIKELLKNDKVKTITVIEKEAEIIKLIAPKVENKRVKIVHGDAREIDTDGNVYDFMIHDIWLYICQNTFDEIKAAKEKYKDVAKVHFSPFEKITI